MAQQTMHAAEPSKLHETNWLLAVDDTIWSYHAFMYLKEIIQQTKENSHDKLYILHVSTPYGGLLPSIVSQISSKVGLDFEEDSSNHTKKLLLFYGKLAQQSGIDVSILRARAYKPADMIIECTSRYKINHVILGQSGASDFMKKYVLGSTCKEVLEHLPQSNVTVVKRVYDDSMTEENLRHQVHRLNLDEIYTQDKLSSDIEHHFAVYHMKPSTDTLTFVPRVKDQVNTQQRKEDIDLGVATGLVLGLQGLELGTTGVGLKEFTHDTKKDLSAAPALEIPIMSDTQLDTKSQQSVGLNEGTKFQQRQQQQASTDEPWA
jgi:nucleotide-binding universal stress UspA family protein